MKLFSSVDSVLSVFISVAGTAPSHRARLRECAAAASVASVRAQYRPASGALCAAASAASACGEAPPSALTTISITAPAGISQSERAVPLPAGRRLCDAHDDASVTPFDPSLSQLTGNTIQGMFQCVLCDSMLCLCRCYITMQLLYMYDCTVH